MLTPFIRFEKVRKAFGKKEVFQDLTLDIYKGETITIIGGSGTGKSILLKLLLGLVRPEGGKIFFDGEDILKMNQEQLLKMRRRVGMLFQGAALFDSVNVYENVAYPVQEHFQYPEEKVTHIVKEKLALVGLSGVESTMPSDLSGGMKKRVGLARAIATEAEVILYDEPTTGLDPTNTNRINDLILALQKQLKVTSVVVTHDMESAFKVSDRLALIHNKQIEFVGTKEEVRHSNNTIVQRFIHGQIGE